MQHWNTITQMSTNAVGFEINGSNRIRAKCMYIHTQCQLGYLTMLCSFEMFVSIVSVACL